jgi:protein TonB
MSYANRKQLSNNRTIPIVMSALITFVLGYALATGLAYSVVAEVAEDLKTFDVQEEPPPPEELPPPPPPDKPLPPPPVTIPPPIVSTPQPQQPVFVAPQPPPMSPPPPPAAPPPPPPPPKPQMASKAVARSGGSIDDSFYPPSAIRNEEQGTSRATFVIGTDGRVQSCNASGATSTLDTETCRQILKWRFKPALDTNGQPIAESRTQNVRWVLPK